MPVEPLTVELMMIDVLARLGRPSLCLPLGIRLDLRLGYLVLAFVDIVVVYKVVD